MDASSAHQRAVAEALRAMSAGDEGEGAQDSPAIAAVAAGTDADQPVSSPAAAPALTKRQISARNIVPGSSFTVENVKKWQGDSDAKPRLNDLQAEVKRRKPLCRPDGYGLIKCVEILLTTPVPEGTPPQGASTDAQNSASSKKKKKGSGGDKDKDKRFNNLKHFPRILHCIVEHKQAFLTRHNKMSRLELEGANRKSIWVLVAQTFNNSAFTPTMVQTDDVPMQVLFDDKLQVRVGCGVG